MEHKHSVFDTDTHFVIDPVSRAIKIGENTKTTLVQTDHNSEVYTFDIPRMIDGHDTLLCNLVEVHYDNIDSATKEKSKGFYKVEDMKVSDTNPEMLCFTWLIKEPATKFVGKIEFSIKFKCIEDGKIAYRWNTIKNKDLTVEASNDNSEVATEEPYPDIIGQWEESLFGIGDTQEQRLIDVSTAQQAAIAAKGEEVLQEAEAQKNAVTARGEAVKASIPADYSALSALADHNRRNKAGAIVLDAQGESILLNDASEYPVTGLKVFGRSEQFATTGRNLLDVEESIDLTNVLGVDVSLPAGEYVVTLNSETHSGDQMPHLRFYTNNIWVQLKAGLKQNVVLSQDENMVYIYTYGMSAAESVGVEASLNQLMISTDGGEYEPYTGGIASPSPDYPQEINSAENPSVMVYGKNLLKPKVRTETINGITFVVSEDGSVTANGTATKATFLGFGPDLALEPGESYILSGCPEGGAFDTYMLYLHYKESGLDVYNRTGETKFTAKNEAFSSVVVIYEGITVSNLVFRPMIRLASIENGDFETHTEQSVTISHTLPGIPVSSGGNYTDANGQRWICDEVDLARGVYVQRVKQQTLTGADSEVWSEYNNNESQGLSFVCWSDDFAIGFNTSICNKFKNEKGSWGAPFIGRTGIYSDHDSARGKYFRPPDNAVTSVAEWKAWLAANGVELVYILANPIEMPLTDAEINAYKALCTNKPNTTILNDAGAYMAVEYVADTKTYIDNKIAELMAK